MKNPVKRGLALLMALVLCIGLLPGVTLTADAATVDYVYSGSYIYNWGKRGTTATFLSQNAEAFYSDNSTSYGALSALSGGTGTSDAPDSALYDALQELMASNHDHITKYDETRSLYQYTDCQNNGGAISSFYSGTAIGPGWDGSWNREHTWPNSKGDGDAEDDIMMLRPTTTSENSSRGNTAYGSGSGFHDPNKVSGGTYNLHGDVARIMLYVYVRWGNTRNMWGSDGVMESLDVLLAWMEEDPVDTWELGRNDAVESITGTRNVFVDYPELAFLLFGEAVPDGYVTPSGMAASSQYTITAQVNDTAMGSVHVNGRTVTATPAEGHYVVDATVTSGDAVISRDGNVFTITANGDCTVTVIFALRTNVAVTYYENDRKAAETTAYAGDPITLPDYSGEVPTGFSFQGWVIGALEKTSEKPAAIHPVGSKYEVSGATDFYALFSQVVDDGTGTSSSVFAPCSGELTEGDYVICYLDEGAMKAEKVSGPRIGYDAVTVTNGAVQSPSAEQIWHIAPTSDGYVTIYNAKTGQYAVSTGKKNEATLADSITDNAKWTVSGTETYLFVNLVNSRNGVNDALRKNSTYGFACYAKGFKGDLTLYKAVSGTVYYATGTCDHTWDGGTVTQNATYDVKGSKTYTCTACGRTKQVSFSKTLAGFEGTSINLGNSLDVLFAFDTAKLDAGTTDAYAVIKKTYADGREPVKVTVPQSKWNNYKDTVKMFSFTGVAAKEMCDQFTVTIYTAQGNPVTEVYTDSIKAYAMRMLAKEDLAEKLKPLYVDALNYGAAAQKQFEYGTGALANAELTDAQKAYATGAYTTENHLEKGKGYGGTSLTLKSQITLDFLFMNSAIGSDYTGLYAVATFTKHNGKAQTVRVDTITAYGKTAGFVSIPGLVIADYQQLVKCTVYNAKGEALAWAVDSMESYANRNQSKLGETVDAIIKFGISAYKYFH